MPRPHVATLHRFAFTTRPASHAIHPSAPPMLASMGREEDCQELVDLTRACMDFPVFFVQIEGLSMPRRVLPESHTSAVSQHPCALTVAVRSLQNQCRLVHLVNTATTKPLLETREGSCPVLAPADTCRSSEGGASRGSRDRSRVCPLSHTPICSHSSPLLSPALFSRVCCFCCSFCLSQEGRQRDHKPYAPLW